MKISDVMGNLMAGAVAQPAIPDMLAARPVFAAWTGNW